MPLNKVAPPVSPSVLVEAPSEAHLADSAPPPPVVIAPKFGMYLQIYIFQHSKYPADLSFIWANTSA